MKALVLIFLFFIAFLQASYDVEIFDGFSKNENFKLAYILDETNTINLENVQTLDFKETSNYNSFGMNPHTLWIKLHVHNKSNIKQELYLHDNFAYFQKNTILYEFKNNQLKYETHFNVLDTSPSNRLTGSLIIYPFILEKESSRTFYLKINTIVSLATNISIYTDKAHHERLIRKNFIPYSIILIITSLALYHLMLYFYNGRKELLFYALYLLNASIGFTYMYGIYFDFSIYGEKLYWFNLTAIFVTLFLAFFIESIFHFKENNPSIYRLFRYLILLSILEVLIALFVDLQIAMRFMPLVYLYSFIVIIYMSYTLHKQKHPLASLFIAAYILYILGFTTNVVSFFGFIPMTAFTFYSSGLGIVLEVILFSYLIHYHTRTLEEKIFTQTKSLLLKNQKEQMGEMIGAITHQWKQPLSTISSIIMLLEYKIEEKDYKPEFFKEKLKKINDTLLFLDSTVNDFRSFFSVSKRKINCNLEKTILKAIQLAEDDTNLHSIEIKSHLNFENTVYILENELLHIILNILQNSKEAFRDNTRKEEYKKLITITGSTNKDHTLISIEDNAGGISKENLPYIFKENFTTKGAKDGTGLGLYLSKTIIEEHMNGTIEATNTPDGTLFRILL